MTERILHKHAEKRKNMTFVKRELGGAWRRMLCFHHLGNALLPMANVYLDAKNAMDVLAKMLRTIDRTMLTTRTSEAEHQRGESTLYITAHMSISQTVDRFQESEYLTVILKETNNRLVKSRELLVGFVTAGIVRRTTVEHITASVATLVLGDALSVGETVDAYH